MKYFSCAYYPEYWGLDRVKVDAVLMRDAGINTVRIGEFAWSRLEPEEGRFEFDWLHGAIDILADHGIKVVLCTPSAAAPAWLVRQHPETLILSKNGRRAFFGLRQHTCYTSPVYRRYVAAIVERLATEMKEHSNILGWQIDNEIGHTIFGLCHCEACQVAFRDWLKQRYVSLDGLNQAWGNGFWSMDYSDWDQVRLGDMDMPQGSSHVQDSLRFHSAMKIDYLMQQADIIRSHNEDTLVTTNHMSEVADRYKAHADLDRASMDIYPLFDDFPWLAYWSDLYRSFKPGLPLWVLETGNGGHGYPGVPHNDRLRAHFWHFFARGAEMVTVFRWRNCLSGYEKDLMGILGHSGVPRKRYKMFQKCTAEINQVTADLGELPLPQADAAVIFDQENLFASCAGRWSEWTIYEEINRAAHRSLTEAGLLTDVIPVNRDLSGYKIVIVPSLAHVKDEFAERLKDFVKAGGIALVTGMTGTFDNNAKYLLSPWPQHLRDLLGISLEDQMVVVDDKEADPANRVMFSGTIDHQKLNGFARHWIGDVELNGGTALMTFENSALKGQPAVVEKRTGHGVTLYVAASVIDPKTLSALVSYTSSIAEISRTEMPLNVEMTKRGDVTFIINHGEKAVSIPWDKNGTAVLGNYADGVIALGGYDVCVTKEDLAIGMDS